MGIVFKYFIPYKFLEKIKINVSPHTCISLKKYKNMLVPSTLSWKAVKLFPKLPSVKLI